MTALLEALVEGGWALASFDMPGLYELSRLTAVPEGFDSRARMAVAEQLRGTLKVHVGYARAAEAPTPAPPPWDARVPHLHGLPVEELAQIVTHGEGLTLRYDETPIPVALPAAAAPVIALVDGRRSLGEIALAATTPLSDFQPIWDQIENELEPWGALHYSRFLL